MRHWTDNDRRNARIGLLLIAALTAACVTIFFIDSIRRATVEGPEITVAAQRAPGIVPGTAVWVAGRPVGRVLSVTFLPPADGADRIVIRAVLERGVDEVLRADAHAVLHPGGLLEPVVVAIDPGTGSLPRWDLARPIPSGTTSMTPERLLEMGKTLADAGVGLADEAGRLRRRVDAGGGTLARLVEHPAVLADAGASLARLDTLVRSGDVGGTFGRLMADTAMGSRLRRIRHRLAVLDTLNARERATASYEEMARAVADFQTRLTRMSARLDAGEGTAGRALHDGAIARQTTLLRARMDSLTVELMKRPDRWLRVKIF